MNKRAAELVKYGELCGFRLDGIDGNKHYVMVHANGSRVRIACTPGDYRGDDNCRAEMRRLSDVTPDVGRRAGRFRKGVRLDTFAPAADRVDSVSAQYARLQGEFRTVCDGIREAAGPGEARPLVRDLLSIEEAIRRLGRPVPTRTFRIQGVEA